MVSGKLHVRLAHTDGLGSGRTGSGLHRHNCLWQGQPARHAEGLFLGWSLSVALDETTDKLEDIVFPWEAHLMKSLML